MDTEERGTREQAGFGALLKRYRVAAGLSQEALAERARLSVGAIGAYERGLRQAPYHDTMALLVQALGLSPEEAARLEATVPRRRGPADAPIRLAPRAHSERPDGTAIPSSPPANPITGASTPAYGGFLGALPSGPLVGREAELRRVLGALDAAAAGQGRLVLLAGEPGVGKTRLAQEGMLHASARGFRVLTGRCHEHYASVPFFPFVEALTGGLGLASPTLRQAAPDRYPYLGRLLPDLIESPPAHEGEDFRLRILRAVGGFLAALADEAPVALLMDDLHWADGSSIELLLYLARQTRGARVALVGTYRDVEVDHRHPLAGTLAELVRDRLVEEVALRGLSPAATAALIGAHFGLAEVPPEVRNLIHARTEGNPFFTEEILKALAEQRALAPSGGGWDRTTPSTIEVPRSIRSVVGQRVGRLASEARELLRVASVVGQEWDLAVVLAAADRDEETVLDALDAALAARLVEERRVGRWERYAFVHALIAQTLYEEVPRHRLRRLHLRVGEALERIRAEEPAAAAELARHFVAAGDARAAAHMIRAGDHAARLFAHAEAVQHYSAALEGLEEAGDEAGAAPVREKLGVELRVLGRYDEALEALEGAAQAWRAAGETAGLGRVVRQIGWVCVANDTPQEGVRRLHSLVQEVEGLGPSTILASLYETLAWVLWLSGHYLDALHTAERTAAMAQTLGDMGMVARANVVQGNVLALLGRLEEGLAVTEAAIPPAEAAKDLESLSCALGNAAYMCFHRGDLYRGRRFAERALETSNQLRDPLWLTWAYYVRGRMHFYLGDWKNARSEMEHALAIGSQAGGWAGACALQAIGQLCVAEGRWDEARQYLEGALAQVGPSGDLQLLRWAACSLAELEIRQGCGPAACTRLEPLLDRPGLEEFDVTIFLPVLAWAYLETGDLDHAGQTIDQAIRRARAEDLRAVLAEALTVRARILSRRRAWDGARIALEEGLALAGAMPYPYAVSCLLQVYGSLHADRGEPEPARARLEAALSIFRQLGARKDSEQAERDLIAGTPDRG